MALSAVAVAKAKPRERAYKIGDSHGLYLLMTPSGGRYWRYNYRFEGKARTMALGVFPEVTLANARAKRDDARKVLTSGCDPTAKRKVEIAQAKFDATTSFRVIAEEWIAKREREGLGDVAELVERMNQRQSPHLLGVERDAPVETADHEEVRPIAHRRAV